MNPYQHVRLDGQYCLHAPACGIVHGTAGLAIGEAGARLRDRRANGENFPGERVRPLYVALRITPDGGVSAMLSVTAGGGK